MYVLPPDQGLEHTMPRYFFHVHDGTSTLDTEGTELFDIFQAQEEAIRLSGALLSELGGKFWDGEDWSLEVTDEAGRGLFTLRFSAKEGPGLEGS
jgi:hypothetical protein